MKKKLFRYFTAFTIALCCCVMVGMGTLAHASSVPAEDSSTEPVPDTTPNTLILQLGPEWAAMEFSVQSDSGADAQVLRVSPEGALTVDLDGGHIYTLALAEGMQPQFSESVPEMVTTAEDDASGAESAPSDSQPEEDAEERDEGWLIPGVPNLHLFLFAGGLLVCIGALVTMQVLKRRRQNYEYEDEDDYGEE